ncbi:hypothetical protein F5887DRAFT_926200 [Amanita rubescens]|nr:hypothetical protein F5887DRAFT_926200 [Amanita rubescens]
MDFLFSPAPGVTSANVVESAQLIIIPVTSPNTPNASTADLLKENRHYDSLGMYGETHIYLNSCPHLRWGGYPGIPSSKVTCDNAEKPYGSHQQLVSAPSEHTDAAAVARAPRAHAYTDVVGAPSEHDIDAATVARAPPAHAYTDVIRRVRGFDTYSSSTPNPPPSTVNAANRDRIQAAEKHRGRNSQNRNRGTRPHQERLAAAEHVVAAIELNFVIWPFVIQCDITSSYEGHAPPKPKFNERKFGAVVDLLSKHNLIFPVNLTPDTPEPWKVIDRVLHEHLRTHEFKLKRSDKDDGNTFNSLAWDVLGRKTKAQENFQTGLAALGNFTVQFLNRQATEVKIESTGRKLSCVLLAPTEGNLRGPVSNLDRDAPLCHLAHACFPWRLLAHFKWLNLKTNVQGSRCINRECPNRNSLRRRRSPSTTPNARNVRQRPTNSKEETDEERSSDDRSPSPRAPRRHFAKPDYMEVSDDEDMNDDEDDDEDDGDVPAELAMPKADIEEEEFEEDDEVQIVNPPRGDDMAIERDGHLIDDSLYDPVESPVLNNLRALLDNDDDEQKLLRLDMKTLEAWQNHLRAQSGQETFTIQAPTFKEASQTLIDMVRVWRIEVDDRKNKPAHLTMGAGPHQYQPIPPVECEIKSWRGLLTPLRPFVLGEEAAGANGDGPAQSIYQGALTMRLNDSKRWVSFQGTYSSLNFGHPPGLHPTRGKVEFQVDGSLTALVMIQLLVEPHPINPFLVYAALFNSPACLEFLLHPYKDYHPNHLLAMIQDKSTRDTFAAALVFPVGEKLDPAKIAKNLVCQRAVEKDLSPAGLFMDPLDEAQHKNFMHLILSDLLIGTGKPWEHDQFLAFTEGLRMHTLIGSLVTDVGFDTQNDMYLYTFKLVSTLWNNRIESYYDVFNRISFRYGCERQHEREARLYAQLFIIRFYRWIRGKGHPRQLVGSVVAKDKYESSLKSPHTTRAEVFWKAVSDMVVLPPNKDQDVTLRLKYMPSLLPSRHRASVVIHTCFKEMSIVLDPDVKNLLLEPNDKAQTIFDLWFHVLMASSANDYNAI